MRAWADATSAVAVPKRADSQWRLLAVLPGSNFSNPEGDLSGASLRPQQICREKKEARPKQWAVGRQVWVPYCEEVDSLAQWLGLGKESGSSSVLSLFSPAHCS